MKGFLKDWVLPPNITKFIQKQVSLHRLKKNDLTVIERNKQLKNKFFGKRCFILGNAPTIKDIDITLLKDEYVFVMSTFYNHPDYKKLNNTIFSSVHLTDEKSYEENVKWMRAINDNTNTTDTFFFDIREKKMIEENNFFQGKDVYYIATANIDRSFDISIPTQGYPTNIVQSLEIAIYMGFTEIYLHSVNLNSICCNGKYEYFFDRKLMPYKDPQVNDDSFCFDFFIQFKDTYNAVKDIYDIKVYADLNNTSIFYTNCESLLKFFKYKNINYLLGENV